MKDIIRQIGSFLQFILIIKGSPPPHPKFTALLSRTLLEQHNDITTMIITISNYGD